jgi:hypothetical protein
MTELTRRSGDPVQQQTGGAAKDGAEGGSRFPVQLKGAGLEAQEKGLSPGAQPGFEAADAARRPVQKRASEDTKQAGGGGGDAKTAKPTTANIHGQDAGRRSLVLMVGAGRARNMAVGDAISWGHCQGVIEELYEFRSKVVFKGVDPSQYATLLERYGGKVDIGAPKHAPPKDDKDDAGAGAGGGPTEKAPPPKNAKKPQFVVAPGSTKVQRAAGGRAGPLEITAITLQFKHGVRGGKMMADSLFYNGSFDDADMSNEALETLKRIVRADTALQELSDEDLAPHVARLVAALKAVM